MILPKHIGASISVLVTLVSGRVALSQPALPGAETSRQADEHYLRGKGLVLAGNVRGAYEEYRQAWSLKKTFDTAANLGNLELTLGMPRDAAEHLAFSVRNNAVTGSTREAVERTKRLFEQARAQVAAVTITLNVDGAEVLVDGVPIGRSPLTDEIYVDPGVHKIEARLPNLAPAQVSIRGEKGSSSSISLVLEAAPAPPPRAESSDSNRPLTGVVVAGSLVGVAALGTGVAMLAISAGKGSSADNLVVQMRQANVGCMASPQQGQCADTLSQRKDHDTFQNVGVPLVAVGGAVAVATLLYGVWPRSPASRNAAWLLPAVDPRGPGFWIGGAF